MYTKARFVFSLVVVLFAINRAYAQQNFTLTGVLFEKSTKNRLALAEVKNKRSGISTGSNDIGLFTIKASIGDTLLITKRSFYDLEVVVNNTNDLVLYLNKGTTLNEVTVTGQTKKQALEEIRKDYKAKGSFYGGKPPILSLLGSPLTFFYELFGKTPKQARRFNRMYQTEMQDSQVDQLFNKTTINQQTGLTGKELEDFLVNYRPTYEQSKNWNVYDSIKWINESYKKYSDTVTKVKSQK
ncbi:hypothetical protein [Pedobacter ureilyticus]|uniref:Carboxypeptidase-like regulatory domain-containing protein n=1 Tax=Pedobacter ureilyticus TaxID=1393051 RepID=A0ABW9J9W4_9SPHI|nr:hypothetical protein [Pedobacter helvus]